MGGRVESEPTAIGASRPRNGRVAHRMGDSPMQTAASPTGMGEAAVCMGAIAHLVGQLAHELWMRAISGDSPLCSNLGPVKCGGCI
uniref:Uncharacterized protein n=1 Tax=Caenorhabditis japonica TaxID=281687 RepID=A0A8R1IHL0_CAEJA